MRAVLCGHAARYTALQPQDALKLVYQSEYGAGHLVSRAASALSALRDEYEQIKQSDPIPPEPIGNGLGRIHLAGLEASGWSLEALNTLFVHGANTHRGTPEGLRRRLRVLRECAEEGLMPFSAETLGACLADWEAAGRPLVRHSTRYRVAYHPAYRVVPIAFWPLLDALAKRRGQRTVLAIDGNSGAGKSSLATLLQAVFGAAVLHMDDFFLPAERKTAERLAEPGGNVDYERVRLELIEPLLAGRAPLYRPYNCQTGSLQAPVQCPDAWLTVVEGVYSLHPALAGAYDLRAFLRLTGPKQEARLLARSGPHLYKRFVGEWLPMERLYFEAFAVAEDCDFVFDVADILEG